MRANKVACVGFALTAGLLALSAVPISPDILDSRLSSIAQGNIGGIERTYAPLVVLAQFNPCPGGHCRR